MKMIPSAALILLASINHTGIATGGGKGATFDPEGQPKQLDKASSAGYFIWHSDKGWHLRVTVGAKKQAFLGRVYVVGGPIRKIHSDAKTGKLSDHWKVTDLGTQTMVSFDFEMEQGGEGIDIEIGDGVLAVRFDVYINRKEMPEQVWIGRDGGHPPRNPFSFAAHPGKKKL